MIVRFHDPSAAYLLDFVRKDFTKEKNYLSVMFCSGVRSGKEL
jgi:hypothetical protein